MVNKWLRFLRKVNMLDSQFMRGKKIKSSLTTYAEFESILVPKDRKKQHPDESYTNEYQKHVAWSYGFKLVCIDIKFGNPFKLYLGEDAAYNFINSMFKESKYRSNVMKEHFKKELVMTKKDE